MYSSTIGAKTRHRNRRFSNNSGNFKQTPNRRPRGGGQFSRSSRYSKKPKAINPERFINKAVPHEDDTPYVAVGDFCDLGFNKYTLENLNQLGLTTPTEIQDKSIPIAMNGDDIIGLANTGTGKTASFLLPIIHRLNENRKFNSILILAPTRELAKQIDTEFRKFSAGQRLYSTLLIGGTSIDRQIFQLRRRPHLIIGTPGRTKDLIERGVLKLGDIQVFVLDEADRMCDMGFEKDIRFIEGHVPENRQTMCFSATMTSSVQSIVEEFMNQPTTVSVVKQATNKHIEQDVVYIDSKESKLSTLIELLEKSEFEKVLIFGETKHGVQKLADKLNDNNLSAAAIHGNKSQSQRERALRQFKDDAVDVLVATDVAARGLDIPNVSHVINFDAPRAFDDYVHRIGRTGRAGKSGVALTFIDQFN